MTKSFTRSIAAFSEALQVMPGGVNSPVRAFQSVDMNPIVMERGEGSRLWDIDGNQYIDFVGSWGPLILGHAHPAVIEAVTTMAQKGTSFGTPTEIETKMAQLVIERMPAVEMVRMVNSGTEATMSALRLARGYTGREKVIKFIGGYHGHSDSFLIKAGSGATDLGTPDSPGIPSSTAQHTLLANYNDLASVEALFKAHGEEIACVIVEPVAGNMGTVPPQPGFLQGLRALTEQYGALLIFDEVITGFRVHLHSAQGLYDVMPDLTTMGKVIGGGLPVGAYGGKLEIMQQIAPLGPVYQAGTLSGNPLAMAAGYTTLQELGKPGVYEELEEKGARLEAGFRQNAEEAGIPVHINRVGSMVCLFFTSEKVVDYETARTANMDHFKKYFKGMIEEGIYMAPSQMECMFVSTAHTMEEIDRAIAANRKVLKRL